MQFIADFHIHSKYSRATSKNMDIENLSKMASIKGLDLLGTGDFTHPLWLLELKRKLKPLDNGLFQYNNVHFILTSEVCNIFTKNGKIRKVHTIIFAPSFEIVDKINNALSKYGDLSSDGRPILSIEVALLAKIILDISSDCLIIPAHAWTPWFSIFGSNSGFDSIEECFGEFSKYIYSIETGLSSDPKMNWRLSTLDKITLISNSDAHSPNNIGREANVFNARLHYYEIKQIIQSKNKEKFLYTIEFFPEEGKYHYDGHRNCNVCISPRETKKCKGICPVCKKPLTRGVLNRVEELADRDEGIVPSSAIPFKNLVPLEEIIAEALCKEKGTVAVDKEYERLIQGGGSEFNILLNLSYDDIKKIGSEKIAEGIIRVREGKVKRFPGYDGEYGKIKVFDESEFEKKEQLNLF